MGFEVRKVANVDGRVPFRAMANAVDDRTKLVNVSQVSYTNGFRHDLKQLADLAHAHGAYLFSDSTQSIGSFPVDVRDDDVDFLTCGVYKWLLGPVGLAFFYIKRELQDQFVPLGHGWKQIRDFKYSDDRTRTPDVVRSAFFDDARRYEFGSVNFHGIYALRPALELVEQIGLTWIEQRVLTLNGYLRAQLTDHGFELFTPHDTESGITTFYVQEETSLSEYLSQQKIAVTARKGCEQIRVSPHFFNTEDDINLFVHHLIRWRESKTRNGA
jgi:selenocysteine lyase/cysteine desulfurase